MGTPSALMIRKGCFDRVGLFDDLLSAHDDWDMWIRIARYYKFKFIEVPLIKYRLHSHRISENVELKIIAAGEFLAKYADELKERQVAHSKLYFNISNMFCHTKKIKEGQKYFIKAILIYPFFIKYYIYLLSSIFGTRVYMHISRLRRYFMNMRKEDYFQKG